MAIDVDLITRDSWMQKERDWNPRIPCIMDVIFTILQEFDTRENIFSTGLWRRCVDN